MAQTEVTPISQDDLNKVLYGAADSVLTPQDDNKDQNSDSQKMKSVVNTDFKWDELDKLLDQNKDDENKDPELSKEDGQKSDEKRPGRKVTDLVAVVNELVEAGELFPFEDGIPKTIEEARELIKLNLAETKKSTIDDIWKQKMESYSPQIQAIIQYAEQGGADVTPLIGAISEVERNNNFNLDTEQGQESVISEFLKVSGWADDEIKEEIETAKDLGKLKSKAEKFLPKLNQMSQQRIEMLMEEQNERERQAQDARNRYLSTIKTTLDKEKLGDIKLSRQEKAVIWDGLTDVRHKSWSGQPTNLFFKKLEEMQAGDKVDYDHFLEIVYHTLNRTAFKDKIREEIKTAEAADTVRRLKIQDRKATSNETIYDEDTKGKNVVRRQSFKNPFG